MVLPPILNSTSTLRLHTRRGSSLINRRRSRTGRNSRRTNRTQRLHRSRRFCLGTSSSSTSFHTSRSLRAAQNRRNNGSSSIDTSLSDDGAFFPAVFDGCGGCLWFNGGGSGGGFVGCWGGAG